MRAVRASKTDAVLVEQIPEPRARPGTAVVRTLSAGICGSDVHTVSRLRRGLDTNETFMGHEVCGEVVELGDGPARVRVGDRVAIEPLARCGACRNCRAGRYNICEKGDFVLGVYTDKAGGLADYFEIPTVCLVPLRQDLHDREGALVEPVAVALHALRMTQPGYRPSVGIVGAGTIGLCAVAAAKAAGAAEITIMARHPTQEQAAMALGATRVLHVDDSATEDEIADKLDGAPLPDVVIEAIGGAARSVNLALEFVRKGGSVSVVGVQWEHNEVELFRLVAKEVRLTGSAVYATPDGVSDFEEAMALMAQNPEVADTLITHDFALADAPEAFATAADRSAGSIKVMVAP